VPGYLLFLTEQAARPVIHAGIKKAENAPMQKANGRREPQERAQKG
jgi:hypothetical protein